MPTASAGNESVIEVDPEDLHREQRQHEPGTTPGGEPDEPGQHDAEEHHQHLAEVRRQQVAQELLDVGVDRAPLLDRRDDRGEVVVGEHDVGGLLRDVGPGDAHRDADVGSLQRRRVVHAVAGHRDDFAERVERAHDPELVLRAHARVDVRAGGRRGEIGVGHPGQVRADQRALAAGCDPQLGRDRRSRRRVVAGDHHDAHPRRVRGPHRRRRLGARRVDHADDAEPDEITLFLGARQHRRAGGQAARGEAERAQRVAGEPLDRSLDLHAPLGGEGALGVADPLVRAAREQDVGRTLRHQHDAPVLAVDMDRAHELALRGERDLAHALEPRFEPRRIEAGLHRRHLQGALGRVAGHRPAPVPRGHRRVVAEARRDQRGFRFGAQRARPHRPAGDAELALRRVAGAGELDGAGRGRRARAPSSRSSSMSRSCRCR